MIKGEEGERGKVEKGRKEKRRRDKLAEVGNGRMGEREKRRRGGGEQGRKRQGEKEKTGKYEKGISSKCEKWRRKDWEKEKAKQKEREQDNGKDERKEKGLCVGQVRAVVSHAPTTDTCFSKVVHCVFCIGYLSRENTCRRRYLHSLRKNILPKRRVPNLERNLRFSHNQTSAILRRTD
jgi:hypothetical protein